MKDLREILSGSAVFAGLDPRLLEQVAGCGRLVHFEAGEPLLRAGAPANEFFVIRHGRVAIELPAPGRSLMIRTVDEGEVVGWSWLFPPYRWHFDAVATVLTRAISLDAECLRGKCGKDPELGYQLMTRFAQLAVSVLESTQEQLLDVYGHARSR